MTQINFKYVKLKNFMSYGNKLIQMDFDNIQALIVGKNGHGKSTIFMALFYALYGKPYKKLKLGSLINNINGKDMYVEVAFAIGESEYLIKRGQKPNIFEIYENGTLIEQSASVADYQDYLETYILKLPEHVFKQLIFFGANVIGNKTFLEMTKAEKDDMFGIITDTSVFSIIRDNINSKLKDAKTKVTDLTYRLGLLEQSIASEASNIQKMEEHNKKAKALRESLENSSEENIQKMEADLASSKEKFGKIVSLKDKYNTLNSMVSEASNATKIKRSEYENVSKELSMIEMTKQSFSVCVGCEKLKTISKADITKEPELLEEQVKLKEELNVLETTESDLKGKLQKLTDMINEGKFLKDKISQLEVSISNERSRLSSLEGDTSEIEINYSELSKLKTDQEKYLKGKSSIMSKAEKLSKLHKLMDNNNLKGIILNQQIPMLNKYINQYLSEFSTGFNFRFYLDQNFKETIMNKNKEVEINSLSNGYSLRVTFSIMFAFLKLVQERSGISTNLLILDEALDGSIDVEGRNELLRIIKNDFNEKSVFIISHNPEIKDNIQDFQRIYEVKNTNGFSNIEEV